jgi:hypothetical protein
VSFFFVGLFASRKGAWPPEDERMDVCVAWSEDERSYHLSWMEAHAWTMWMVALASSFWVGLVWSDSNGVLSVVLLYFRQRKTARVDLLFKILP